jgi:hypothetical protein
MSRRAWTLFSFAACFVVDVAGWIHILVVDRCFDYGGAFENGVCIGTATPAPTFWDYLWPLDPLLVLVPPAVLAAVVVSVMVWYLNNAKHRPR